MALIVYEEPRPVRWRLRAVVAGVVLLGVCVGLSWPNAATTAKKQKPPPPIPNREQIADAPQAAGADSTIIAKKPITAASTVARINVDGIGADVKREVERVTRPRQVAFALFDDGKRRLAFLLVDYPERYYQLDFGLVPENVGALKSGQFLPPPDPLPRTISIYRSLTKRAMSYRPTGEDRLIILLCPSIEWLSLQLDYSEYRPGPLPGEQDIKRPSTF